MSFCTECGEPSAGPNCEQCGASIDVTYDSENYDSESAGPILLGGKYPTRIYMLDNSLKTLLIDSLTTAKEVCRSMAEKLGFENPKTDAKYFGLYEALNGAHVNRCLKNEECVLAVTESWGIETPNALLVYQCKLFMNSMFTDVPPKVLYLLYAQAVHHVITGIYPVDAAQSVYLAALQVQTRYGDHNPDSHKVGFLTEKIAEFIPTQLIGEKPFEEWESMIFEDHASLVDLENDSRIEYVEYCRQFPMYGNQFFTAKQSHWKGIPKTIALGISARGVFLYKPGMLEMLKEFPLREIFRWGFKPGHNFYFEGKGEGDEQGPVYEFETEDGESVSDLLTDYAMAMLHELGMHTEYDESEDDSEYDEDDEEDSEDDDDELDEESAAIRIQSLYRGYRTRLDFDEMITAIEEQLIAEEETLEEEAVEEETLEADTVEEESVKVEAVEEESMKVEAVEVKTLEVETLEVEAVEEESMKVEAVEEESVKVEAVEVKTLEVEAVEEEAIKVEAVEVEAVTVETLEADTVEEETLEEEAVEVEAVKVEAVEVETLEVEAVEEETLEVEAVKIEAVEVKTLEVEAVEVDTDDEL